MIWDLADVLMGFMAIMNIIVIIYLGKIPFKCLKDFQEQKRAGKNPIFHPEKIGVKNAEFWNNIESEYKETAGL